MPYAPKIVKASTDLRRIRDLPRRAPLNAKTAAAHVRKWTAHLSRGGAAELKWAQAWALEEWSQSDTGGVGFLPVGTGKTLLLETLPLACAEVDGKDPRSVLILPASLEQKTFADRRALRKDWRLATPPPTIVTRETFHREENLRLLDKLKPTLIMLDEGDEGANFDASVPTRIHRYVTVRRAAGFTVRVVIVTGTPGRRSILNYWHFLIWGCGEDGAPVPKSRADAELWALALDDGNTRQGWRPKPGALGETLDGARAWYAHRLRETPGVIIVDEDSAAKIPLTVTLTLAPDCPEIEAAFDRLAHDEESPAGMPVTDALSLQRIKGQLGCGFFTYYDPPPPEDWADARRAVAKLIRARIAQTRHSAKPLDTEAAVMRASPDHPAVRDWLQIKDEYVPADHAHTDWLSTATLDWARKWLADADEPSILWCGWTEFGERLRALTRLPYYGPKGREVKSGRELHSADAGGRDRVIVSSWHANKRGFNLQAWRRHAIVQPPQSAKYLEQLFGRPHRQGQTQPVRFTLLLTSGATLDSFNAALSEARFVQQTASTTQKLLRAKLIYPRGTRDGFRWIEQTEDE